MSKKVNTTRSNTTSEAKKLMKQISNAKMRTDVGKGDSYSFTEDRYYRIKTVDNLVHVIKGVHEYVFTPREWAKRKKGTKIVAQEVKKAHSDDLNAALAWKRKKKAGEKKQEKMEWVLKGGIPPQLQAKENEPKPKKAKENEPKPKRTRANVPRAKDFVDAKEKKRLDKINKMIAKYGEIPKAKRIEKLQKLGYNVDNNTDDEKLNIWLHEADCIQKGRYQYLSYGTLLNAINSIDLEDVELNPIPADATRMDLAQTMKDIAKGKFGKKSKKAKDSEPKPKKAKDSEPKPRKPLSEAKQRNQELREKYKGIKIDSLRRLLRRNGIEFDASTKRKEIIELIESNNLEYKKRERKEPKQKKAKVVEVAKGPPLPKFKPINKKAGFKKKPITETNDQIPPSPPPPVSVSEPVQPPITETNDAVGTETPQPPLNKNRESFEKWVKKVTLKKPKLRTIEEENVKELAFEASLSPIKVPEGRTYEPRVLTKKDERATDKVIQKIYEKAHVEASPEARRKYMEVMNQHYQNKKKHKKYNYFNPEQTEPNVEAFFFEDDPEPKQEQTTDIWKNKYSNKNRKIIKGKISLFDEPEPIEKIPEPIDMFDTGEVIVPKEPVKIVRKTFVLPQITAPLKRDEIKEKNALIKKITNKKIDVNEKMSLPELREIWEKNKSKGGRPKGSHDQKPRKHKNEPKPVKNPLEIRKRGRPKK